MTYDESPKSDLKNWRVQVKGTEILSLLFHEENCPTIPQIYSVSAFDELFPERYVTANNNNESF